MHSGNVSAQQQALITIDVLDRVGRSQPLEVVVDTGFTGSLTLPTAVIGRLDLPSAGGRTFELANGESFDFDVYDGWVLWHGRRSRVVVLQAESTPLLGVELLWGSRLTVDALAGGTVEIEELGAPP